jgi:hypothetical protein
MGDFVPNFERRDDANKLGPRPIPTAGAIPVCLAFFPLILFLID